MATIAKERRVWRELVQTHFTPEQIEFLAGERPTEFAVNAATGVRDWRTMYKALRRKFGLREEGFAEALVLCRRCSLLYWQTIGHPCLVEEENNNSGNGLGEDKVLINPSAFLAFFSV